MSNISQSDKSRQHATQADDLALLGGITANFTGHAAKRHLQAYLCIQGPSVNEIFAILVAPLQQFEKNDELRSKSLNEKLLEYLTIFQDAAFLQTGRRADQESPREKKPRKKRRKKLPERLSQLINILCVHHMPYEGPERMDHLSIRQIHERLKCPQSKASKLLKLLMGEISRTNGKHGMKAYKFLCSNGWIHSELSRVAQKHLNPHFNKHFLHGDLSWIKDPSSDRSGNNDETSEDPDH